MSIEVVLLGTGNPIPDVARAGPSTLLRAGDVTLLVDCGRAVLQRAAAVGVQAGGLTALLVTHLHSDHLTDLGDILTTRWITTPGPVPLRVVGPPRTAEVVDAVLASVAPDVEYRMAHHKDLTWAPSADVLETTEGVVLETGGVRVVAAPTEHKPVASSVAYRVEHEGRAVVVAGDTVPCESLDRLCDGADALVQTVAREDMLAAIPIPRSRDIREYHSTVEEAAQTAARAGLQTLVLTHYVPGLFPGAEEQWRAMAAAHFDGAIHLGDDLLTVEVK